MEETLSFRWPWKGNCPGAGLVSGSHLAYWRGGQSKGDSKQGPKVGLLTMLCWGLVFVGHLCLTALASWQGHEVAT